MLLVISAGRNAIMQRVCSWHSNEKDDMRARVIRKELVTAAKCKELKTIVGIVQMARKPCHIHRLPMDAYSLDLTPLRDAVDANYGTCYLQPYERPALPPLIQTTIHTKYDKPVLFYGRP